jgi:hypothetical protein
MQPSQNCLVVVSILEGRSTQLPYHEASPRVNMSFIFVVRSLPERDEGSTVLVRGKLGSSALSTDPLPAKSDLSFNEDLVSPASLQC